MVMRLMRDGVKGGFLKYMLFGILVMSVGGLVLMDVRGVFSGSAGVGGNDVALIGKETISIRNFDRTLRRAIAQYRIPPEKAFKMGLADEILTGQIRTYLLSLEAKSKGLELNKDRLALRVADIVKPTIREGQSMQDALEELLRRQGMSEIEFVETMKREVSGELLMQIIRGAFSPETTMLVNNLYQFQNHTRDIDVILFADAEVQGIEPATEEQLKNIYEAVKRARFKIPEYRTAKIAVFNPESLNITVDVTEEEVKQAYDDNLDRFRIGEQLVLTQALIDSKDQAKEIYDLVQSGKDLKEAVISVTGSSDKYIENTVLETSSMLPDLMEGIKDIEVGGVATPVNTMLGNHVVRLDKVIEPSIRPYEEVKEGIRKSLIQEKEYEEIYKVSENLDESLDSGTSFEEISKSEDIALEISSIIPFDVNALNKQGENALADFNDQDNNAIKELVFELVSGETSLLQELPSGKLAAFTLVNVEAVSYNPYEGVKDELAQQYIDDNKHVVNRDIVGKYLAEIGTGGSNFEGIAKDNKKAVQSYKGLSLSGELPAPFTAEARPAIFQAEVGGYDVIELEGQVALIKLAGYNVPEIVQSDETKQALAAISKTVNKEIGDEAFLMYVRELGDKIPTKVNRSLLDQAYGQSQEEGN